MTFTVPDSVVFGSNSFFFFFVSYVSYVCHVTYSSLVPSSKRFFVSSVSYVSCVADRLTMFDPSQFLSKAGPPYCPWRQPMTQKLKDIPSQNLAQPRYVT